MPQLTRVGKMMAARGSGDTTPTPPPSFTALGVTFNGATGLARNAALTGQSAGATGIWSVWFKGTAALVGGELLDNLTDDIYAFFNTGGRLVLGVGPSGSFNYQNESAGVVNDDVWHHALISIDGANQIDHFYIDDVDAARFSTPFSGPTSAYHFDDTGWSVGRFAAAETDFCTGDFAEIYFAPNQYLDLSITANRRKFIGTDGKPVDLGANGSAPTGTAPAIYMSVRSGDAASAFATNRGSGGAFTLTGSLTLSSTNPQVT